ncbi:STAS domain-containing protein [Sphingomonas sp. CROZ-RG-20F-R02-07]|uniref:STAS domain-containing protein n=1 Tax=Sphingomonas sp. CROZ-RG-20F-R02-07 TaxID=2914832 RepID=UPI001F56B261|nr:STAS domain-containing protein [Sphingomonas sp. CROZ-RG-20F-R02-07]
MATEIRTAETVTIQSVADLHAELSDGLAAGADIVIDASPIRAADLSFVQLVTAARIEAERRGTALTLAQPANAVLTALLDRAGFTAQPDPASAHFWFHGECPR